MPDSFWGTWGYGEFLRDTGVFFRDTGVFFRDTGQFFRDIGQFFRDMGVFFRDIGQFFRDILLRIPKAQRLHRLTRPLPPGARRFSVFA